MQDILIGVGATIIVSAIGSFLTTLLKKGDFETWGKMAGKFVSRIIRLKFGKKKWEKLEDILGLIVLTFAKGFKNGLDIDDKMSDDQLVASIKKGEKHKIKKNSDGS